MQPNFWDMGVWCLGITNALRNKCSMPHYPPQSSTLTLFRNIISKIFLFYKHPIFPIQTPLQGYFRHFQAVYKQLSLGYTCHMSGYIEFKNNPMIRAHLDKLRIYNKQRMSICHWCNSDSIDIRAEGYVLYPACEEHLDNTRQ